MCNAKCKAFSSSKYRVRESRRYLLPHHVHLRHHIFKRIGSAHRQKLQVTFHHENSRRLRNRYVGEWYDENESEDGLPTGEMRSNASKTLYVTAGVYGGFVILSLLCIGIDAKRS